jgi:NADH:ubiquinone oxidoreductase subunit C
VPGLVETREAYGETTLVVDPARLVEACTYLRDSEGFNFLADVAATDYLGWGGRGVAGYIGDASGRDLNRPGSQGLERTPDPKPRRFAMNYHLLAVPSRSWGAAGGAGPEGTVLDGTGPESPAPPAAPQEREGTASRW